jgi:hypothetical protein
MVEVPMVQSSYRLRRVAVLAGLGLALAGCAGGGLSMFGVEQPTPDVAQPSALQATTPGRVVIPTQPATASFDCPGIEVRPGTEVLRLAPPGREAVPTDLRWQASITLTERECVDGGGRITMRIGIEGNVLLGPQGAPGPVRLPVRVAVIKGDNTVLSSRVVPIDVVVPAGQTGASFAVVDEGTSVVRAPGDRLTDVSVAVGFDPAPQRPERGRRRG